jgi:N-methylhydantoinase A/oxoprolinase/acetone carboxylase beta subunit
MQNLLTFDMGGTSTDVCLVENGVPQLRRESVIGDLTSQWLFFHDHDFQLIVSQSVHHPLMFVQLARVADQSRLSPN